MRNSWNWLVSIAIVWGSACKRDTVPATTPGTATTTVVDAGSPPVLVQHTAPSQHRAEARGCDRARGPGVRGTNGGTCDSDDACKAGHNGRCRPVDVSHGRMPAQNQCDYDACFLDDDCGAGQLCDCGHDATTAGFAHVCRTAGCRKDSECGAGGFCSPAREPCWGGLQGYFCHKPQDECYSDSECQAKYPGGDKGSCLYEGAAKRWACQSVACPVG